MAVVDVTASSGSGTDVEILDIVDITVDSDSEDDIAEVPAGAPPLCFGGYRRGRELGRGASGQVFVCHRKGCASGYAVKTVSLRRLSLSPNPEREQKRLCREVEILRRLPPHPSVVQLVDVLEQGSWYLIVLELVGGGDLLTALMARPAPRLLDREAAFIARQLADGLAFLHSQGVIHRDLKLENLLVASERRLQRPPEAPLVHYTIKITDFGLSKGVGAGRSEARSLVGTRPYTAPEILGAGLHDFNSDLWSFGVLLYVLLVGRYPFDRAAPPQAEVYTLLMGLEDVEQSAKSVLCGFLQLEPAQRLALDALCSHVWLQDESLESPRSPQQMKRQRSSSPFGALGFAPAVSPAVAPSSGQTSAYRNGLPLAQLSWQERGGSPCGALASATEVTALRMGGPASDEAAIEAALQELLALAGSLPVDMPNTCGLEADVAMQISPRQLLSTSVHSASMTSSGPYISNTCGLEADVAMQISPRQPLPTAAPSASISFSGPSAGMSCAVSLEDGVWTPLAVEASMRLSDVRQVSAHANVMQVHMVVPDRLAGFVLGRNGARIQQIAATAGCPVSMTPRRGAADRRIVMIGSYKRCKVAQELVHEQLAEALQADWRDTEAEVLLFVRAEAAGAVAGKRGFVLGQIREQSGARIQLWRDEVHGQRPCAIVGALQSVLRAQKHMFDIVSAVPKAAAALVTPQALQAALPRRVAQGVAAPVVYSAV